MELASPESTTPTWMWTIGYLTVGVITCVGCCSYVLQRRKATAKMKKEKDFIVNQVSHPKFPLLKPGEDNAPILTGVRVVELATVVAGPSAARCLADHGAEVIKVETSNGDMWRNYLKVIEKKRFVKGGNYVSSFEHVNFNKSSIVLDVSKGPKQVAQLHELLSKADVFITNVRLPSLQKLGLDYCSIKNTHPHLIYGHLSAWGLVGPGRSDPGYDFGAFWSRTGMSTLMNGPGTYSQYPGAFGDTITGLNLVSGILIQLRRRLQNGGIGSLVETSLLRTGMWVNAPMILREVDTKGGSGTDIPAYRQANSREHCSPSTMTTPFNEKVVKNVQSGEGKKVGVNSNCGVKAFEVYDQYVTKDRIRFALLELGTPKYMLEASKRLQNAIDEIVEKNPIPVNPIVRRSSSSSSSNDGDMDDDIPSFRLCCLNYNYDTIDEMLTKHNISHMKTFDYMSATTQRDLPEHNMASLIKLPLAMNISESFVHSDLPPDVKIWCRSPFDFSCSDQHSKIHRRAPELGAHTVAILEKKEAFVKRPTNHPSCLPKVSANDVETIEASADRKYVPPLSDVIMIELSTMGPAVSAAGCLVGDEGGRVIQIIVEYTDDIVGGGNEDQGKRKKSYVL
jgi:crotonobetainyl-CoA:carnitine CoA-transferase CaiB-like acyl-CoA transferase